MRRVLFSVLSAILAVGAFAAFVWYFAYRLDPAPPRVARVMNLDRPAEVSWTKDGLVSISADDTLDAVAALGFGSVTSNPWTTVLLRQAALGRLGEWFGSDALELDIAARMLGISERAEAAYSGLDARSKSILAAYADGLNAAMGRNALRNSNLVLLGIDKVDRWQPWHSIAVERLFAWLATSIEMSPTVDEGQLPLDLSRLLAASDKLREWLDIDGLNNSSAWAVRQSDETLMFYRIVYGSSIESYFHEFSIQIADKNAFACMALVGTPYLFSGRSSSSTWAILPHQKAFVEVGPSLERTTERSRIRFADGSEQLIAFHLSRGRLDFPVDTTTSATLAWAGLTESTDAASWSSIIDGRQPDFHLLDGTRLTVQRSGAWTTGGPEEAVLKINSGVYVSHSEWARFPSERLASWVGNKAVMGTEPIKDDQHSTWAGRLLPALLGIIASNEPGPDYQEAVDYLRNWDGRFTESSIAGSIFDSWAVRMWLSTGIMPGIAGGTLDTATVLSAFRATVDRLRTDFGSDASKWRWERVQQNERDWPMWLMMRRRSPSIATTRYAPIRTVGSGHPSTVQWGATSYTGRGSPPGRWESWISTADWIWRYSDDTRLDPTSNFRRSDALLNTVLDGQVPDADAEQSYRTSLLPR